MTVDVVVWVPEALPPSRDADICESGLLFPENPIKGEEEVGPGRLGGLVRVGGRWSPPEAYLCFPPPPSRELGK